MSGFSKITINCSRTHTECLKQLGATTLLERDATAEDFAEAIGDYTVLDFIMNTISIESTKQLSVDIVTKVKTTKAPTTKIIIVLVGPLDFEAFHTDELRVALSRILGAGSFPSLRYISEPFLLHLGGKDRYIAQGKFLLLLVWAGIHLLWVCECQETRKATCCLKVSAAVIRYNSLHITRPRVYYLVQDLSRIFRDLH